MSNEEYWMDTNTKSDHVDDRDGKRVSDRSTREDDDVTAPRYDPPAMSADDDDDDDDDVVSEERQRRAAVLVCAGAEIRRAWVAGDWQAALFFLQRSDSRPWGPYCRACAPAHAPDPVRIRTASARAAAKLLEDEARKSWGPHCLSCGTLM
jgi:hypothetical protein